jgi:nitrogen fixation protein NifU and related proteins
MSADLRELYQTVILDHNKHPRNQGMPPGANRHAEGHNPLCGDHLSVHVALDGGVLKDVGFEGNGCAISKASASLMTDSVKGKTIEEAEAMFERFHRMITRPADEAVEDLGKLSVFAGVRQFPVRVKCASLAWHTLHSAIAARDEVVSTE